MVVAEIRKDCSKAVFVGTTGCSEEETTRDWVASLDNMTLNKVVLPPGERVYQDVKGQPMPPKTCPTEFHYVDGGLEQADTRDFMCVNRVIAEPWRQFFAGFPVDMGESEDLLSVEELDLVQGYMDQPLHDWVTQREGKGQDKAWSEVDAIVSCSYHANTFVRRVLDHMSIQDELIGENPPTYGDHFGSMARDPRPEKTPRAEDKWGSYPSSKFSGPVARQDQGGVQRVPQDRGIEGQVAAEVWGHLLQWKACLAATGPCTVR